MKLTMRIVDAFTDTLFGGNPAAVCILEQWLPESLMQSIATENNLSETAFIVRDEQGICHIRWFSPLTEIDFCGHATLASAFVLFQQDHALSSLTFSASAVGQMQVKQGSDGRIYMSFPPRKPKIVQDIPVDLLAGLSIVPDKVYLNQQAYFAVYSEESAVLSVQQDPNKLKKLAPYDVVVTAPGREYDFVSRYFWPANGGDEDPVTGSIHAGLAPFWAEALAKNTLVAYQASSRGGILYCELKGGRVILSGNAVQYLEGSITI